MTRWVLTAVAAALAALVIGGNLVAGIRAQRRGRSYSSIPFVGGLFGMAACLLCPLDGSSWFALVFLVLDYTFPGLLYAVFVDKAFRE